MDSRFTVINTPVMGYDNCILVDNERGINVVLNFATNTKIVTRLKTNASIGVWKQKGFPSIYKTIKPKN